MSSIGQLASTTLALPITASTALLSGITGAATTYAVGDMSFFINGKSYQKATATGVAFPSTDSAAAKLADGTLAGLAIATGFGTVLVWTINSGGTVAIYRGETVALDAGNNLSKAPFFPTIPDTAAVIGYTLHRNYTGSTFTLGTTNWNTGSSAHTTVPCGFLPDRPQAS